MPKSAKLFGWAYLGVAFIFFLGFSYREIREHGWASYFQTEKQRHLLTRPTYRHVTIGKCMLQAAIWPYYLLAANTAEE